MKKTYSISRLLFMVYLAFAFVVPMYAYAEATTTPECISGNSFDDFNLGSVNGQGGWRVTGTYDQEVVSNIFGYPTFGCKSLRISDATTSVFIYDQIFSTSTVNEVGETDAQSGDAPIGVRQTYFEAQFDLASVTQNEQPGMHLSVSPDRGDGTRMSSLGFEDTFSGINIYFDDVIGTSSPVTFRETQIATALTRSLPHTIKFSMDFLDGEGNDVVSIYVDGVLAHTGTSWENFYRFDQEAFPSPNNTSRTVNSLVFYERGTASSSDLSNGYLIDNVLLATGTTTLSVSTTTTATSTQATSTDSTSTSTPPIETTQRGGAGGPNGYPGCIDKTATNYDPTAIYTGTCTYATLEPGLVLGVSTSTVSNSTSTATTSGNGPFITISSLSSSFDSKNKHNFLSDLKLGSRGEDVSWLQEILMTEGFLIYNGTTSYFGPLTQSALKKWQAKNGINSTGYFGRLSRAFLNR